MKKILVAIIAMAFGLGARADWIYDYANQSIPDGSSVGITRTIDLSGAALNPSLVSIDIALRISGDSTAFAGDLYAYLVSGSGERAVLLNRIGVTASDPFGSLANGVDVVFSLSNQDGSDIHILDDVDAGLIDGDGRLTGRWGADGRDADPALVADTTPRTAGLESFASIDPNTEWTLFVADVSGGGEAKLDYWGVNIQAVPEPAVASLIGLMSLVALFLRRRLQA